MSALGAVDPFAQARQYLARVLPWPNAGQEVAYVNVHNTYVSANATRPMWSGRACTSLDDAINAIQRALKGADTRDIYVCMSTQSTFEERVTNNGWKWRKPVRSQQTAVALKSLFLDIDCKGEGYASLEEAGNALAGFIASTALPRPSIVVGSGGGLHVYWVLAVPLTPDKWKPLAYALAEATKRHGLKCDTQCTIDCARVLRIPNTFNRKSDPPRPVKIVGTPTDFDYSVERIEKALAPYKVAVPSTVSTHSYLEQSELWKPRVATAPVENELGAGIELHNSAPIDLDDVAKECGFIRDAIATGGLTYANPLWNLTTLISTFTQGSRADAHRMGDKHPGYSQASTDELFDRKVREKTEKGLGWPACATISGSGCKACQGCPHFAAGKSPLNLAAMVRNSEGQTTPLGGQPTVLPLPSQVTPASDLPTGFARDHNSLICEIVTREEDNSSYLVPVTEYTMDDAWLQEGSEGPILNFSTRIKGRVRKVKLPFNDIGTMSMRAALQTQHVMMPVGPKAPERVGRFMVAWVRRLQETKETVKSSNFGWSVMDGNVRGFVYGGHMWTPNGAIQAPVGDPVIARCYEPVGDVEPWRTAAKMVTDQKRPGLEILLASAFASPLVRFTGEPGVLMSVFSGGTGANKSTVQKIAQAVWGDPVTGRNVLDDKELSVIHKMGQLQSLPVYWDEIKGLDQTKRFVHLTFQVSQGKERSRLTNRITQREPGRWETLLVSCSNGSIMDYIIKYTSTTTAGLYRVFEYEIKKAKDKDPGRLLQSDVSIMVSKLNDNFGHVGLQYAKFLGANCKQIALDLQDELRQVHKDHHTIQDERFWTLLLASIRMGARYANQLRAPDGKPYVTFDEAAIKDYLGECLGYMREFKLEQRVDMGDKFNVTAVLGEFLNVMRERHTIMTDRIHMGRGKPPTNPPIKILNELNKVEDVHVQIGLTQKLMLINKNALMDYLFEKGTEQSVFIKALKEELGASVENRVIGGGTTKKRLPDYTFEIDMRMDPALLDFCN